MSARRRRRTSADGADDGTDGRKRLILLIGGVAVVAFLVSYGLTALAFTSGGAPADVVLVPDVRERSLEDARELLDDEELSLVVGDSFPNPNVPAGAVLAQTPLPGQEVSPGTEVTVLLSTGQPRPTVPVVESMPLALATRSLEAAGFQVVIEEAPGEGPPGRVVSVTPAAGTPVPLPATVVVRVGANLPYREMPNVIGMPEEAAKDSLESLGFHVAEVLYETSESIEPYRVVAQNPIPGDTVETGAVIRLRVTLPGVTRP